MVTEAVETCPYCGCDNIFGNKDCTKEGYIETCWQCGKKIFLCDECKHADDNSGMMCDWHECMTKNKFLEGRCFRGVIKMEV